MANNNLPETGFVRLSQIIGNPKAGIVPIIPVSRSSWLLGVEKGIYPKSIKLSERSVAYKVDDIRALIESLSKAHPK